MYDVVRGHRNHHRVGILAGHRQRGEPVCVGRATRRRLDDQVLVIDLREDHLDDFLLTQLGDYEDVIRKASYPLIGVTQQRPATAPQRKGVLGRRPSRTRPHPRPRASGWNDRDSLQLSSSASSLARAVDSQGASMSVRPKWPYTAVWRNSGRLRLSSLMMPSGLRSKGLPTAAEIAASGAFPVPNV